MNKPIEQGSPEWHAQRVGRITASKVGAILGVNPWRTADDVLRAMVREYHGAPSEFTGNAATAWGVANEAGAAIDYTLDTGRAVEPAYYVALSDTAGASPDGYVGDDGLVEIKCPFGKREITDPDEFKSLEEQPYYFAQIIWQLLCTGRDWCDFYQWAPACQKLERVEFDFEYAANLARVCEAFHARYLEERDNPEHLEPLRKVIGVISDSAAEKMESNAKRAARMRISNKVLDYFAAKDRAKEADAEAKEILADLVVLAGGKDAQIGDHKLTLVERKGSISYAKIVKSLLPDEDLEPFRGSPSSYWRLS